MFEVSIQTAADAVPTRVCTLIVTAGKGCCWRRGDPGTLPHTPQHPGWPRAEPADGQERGQGSWVAPRPELRDLHQLPCFFHSGSDRNPRRCWVRKCGGLAGAVGRDGRCHPIFVDSEDLEQGQSSPLAQTPHAQSRRFRPEAQSLLASLWVPGWPVAPVGPEQGLTRQRSEPRPHQPGCWGHGRAGELRGLCLPPPAAAALWASPASPSRRSPPPPMASVSPCVFILYKWYFFYWGLGDGLSFYRIPGF